MFYNTTKKSRNKYSSVDIDIQVTLDYDKYSFVVSSFFDTVLRCNTVYYEILSCTKYMESSNIQS